MVKHMGEGGWADSFSEGAFQLSLTQLDSMQTTEEVACGYKLCCDQLQSADKL